MKSLEGRVAVITGATSGIGEASAHRFAKEGAKVMITGRNEERANAVVDGIRANGGDAAYVLANLADYKTAPQKLLDATLEKYGTVDILFNNAGTTSFKSAAETDIEDFIKLFHIEVTSHLRLSQLVYPIMKEKGKGNILFNDSISGFLAHYNDLSYVAAKHSIVGITKRLAMEFAPEIRVNAIAPGSTMTKIIKDLGPGAIDYLLPRIALGRFSEPEEQANVAFFLVSDEASYIDGQVIRVDGGIEL